MTTVNIKKLHPEAKLPSYAHEDDSGMDLYALASEVVPAHQRLLVRTGLSVAIPPGFELQVRPKSGLALNYGLTVLNTPGTVDAGYRGEIGVILMNHSERDFRVEQGSKIAQAVICKVERATLVAVEDLSESQRGTGGFGSTGLT